MSTSLKSLFNFFLHPIALGALLLLLALISQKLNGIVLARTLWFTGGLWFFLLIFTPLPHYLLGRLEKTYPSLCKAPAFQTPPNILVLASGFTHDTTLLPGNQLGATMLQRVVEGLRLKGQYPQAKLIFSGPTGERPVSQASIAAQTAVDLGLSPQDTALLENPLNTLEEASYYQARYTPATPLILGLPQKVALRFWANLERLSTKMIAVIQD